jgi:hypothetical protein
MSHGITRADYLGYRARSEIIPEHWRRRVLYGLAGLI